MWKCNMTEWKESAPKHLLNVFVYQLKFRIDLFSTLTFIGITLGSFSNLVIEY